MNLRALPTAEDANKAKLLEALDKVKASIEAGEFDGIFIGMCKRNLPGEDRGSYATCSIYEGLSGLEAAGMAATMMRDVTSTD